MKDWYQLFRKKMAWPSQRRKGHAIVYFLLPGRSQGFMRLACS